MTSQIDNRIEAITLRLKKLLPKKVATFSACAVERNIELFDVFTRRLRKSDANLGREALDTVWDAILDIDTQNNFESLIARVEYATPKAMEDDSSIGAIAAQNLSIALDSMLRWCLPEIHEPLSGEFVFEALRAVVTDLETGYYELGSGQRAAAFEHTLLKHPIIKREFDNQLEDLELLERYELSRELVLRLKSSAQKRKVEFGAMLLR